MTPSWRLQRRRTAVVRGVLIVIAIVVALTPIVWTLLAAIGIEPNESVRPPTLTMAPTLDHLADVGVAEPAFWQELATSLGVSAAAAVIAVAISFLAAYGLARSSGRQGHRLIPGLIVLASLPVMAYVIPLGDLMRRLGLLDTLPGVVLAEAAVTAPLAVYVLYAYLSGTSTECEEAARLEGAGLARVIRHVVLPTAAPILAATVIVLFVLDWNLLLIPLVLTGIDVRTLPVVLTDFFTLERELDWPTAAAALTISLIPVLILVAVLNRLLDRFSLGLGSEEPTV